MGFIELKGLARLVTGLLKILTGLVGELCGLTLIEEIHGFSKKFIEDNNA